MTPNEAPNVTPKMTPNEAPDGTIIDAIDA